MPPPLTAPVLCGIPPDPTGLVVPRSPARPGCLRCRDWPRWCSLLMAQTRGVSWGAPGGSLGKGDAGEGQLGETRVACAPISSTNPPLWGEALAARTGPNLINSVVRNTGTCQGALKHRLRFPDNASHLLSSCSDPGGGLRQFGVPFPGNIQVFPPFRG